MMKRAAILLTVALLSGCAGLTNSYFDPVEYGRYADISTSSRLAIAGCAETNRIAATSTLLVSQTELAVGYSQYKIQNQRITAAARELQALTNELAARYSAQAPSVGYCQLKLAQISTAAETIARSIGKKED